MISMACDFTKDFFFFFLSIVNFTIENVTYGNGVTLICKLLWSKWSELDFITLLIILTEITMIIVNI